MKLFLTMMALVSLTTVGCASLCGKKCCQDSCKVESKKEECSVKKEGCDDCKKSQKETEKPAAGK